MEQLISGKQSGDNKEKPENKSIEKSDENNQNSQKCNIPKYQNINFQMFMHPQIIENPQGNMPIPVNINYNQEMAMNSQILGNQHENKFENIQGNPNFNQQMYMNYPWMGNAQHNIIQNYQGSPWENYYNKQIPNHQHYYYNGAMAVPLFVDTILKDIITIIIEDFQNKKVEMKFKNDKKFEEVILNYKEKEGIKGDYEFLFNGKIVDSNKTLEELGIKNNSYLLLIKKIIIDETSLDNLNNSENNIPIICFLIETKDKRIRIAI